ncbi:MAG: signal peptidase II [Actinomycetota bacterium]|nr:signal peptidase II [Actinomycetota bacterium]
MTDDVNSSSDEASVHPASVDLPEQSAPSAVTAARHVSPLPLLVAVAVALVVADQVSKHWALNALSGQPPRHVLWTLQWNLTFNSGMAFSKGQSMGPVIGVLALLVVGFVVVNVRHSRSRLATVAAGCVVGGALGNVVDRLFRGDGWLHGSVVDFIDFQWFPIFNIADIAVNVGGGLFVIWSLFTPHEATT